jgi:hypothetical protein
LLSVERLAEVGGKMIPARFAVEYPERRLRLLQELEPSARKHGLLASFSILVASSAILIPYERMQSRHPMHRKGRDGDLSTALRSLDKKELFSNAQFWKESSPGDWRFSRIFTELKDVGGWRDDDKRHPMAVDSKNTIALRNAGQVVRVIRNALAHGNIVYLNTQGLEEEGTRVAFLAFLSRYEETEAERKLAETYRLLVTTEESFLHFVKQWTAWVASFHGDVGIVKAA